MIKVRTILLPVAWFFAGIFIFLPLATIFAGAFQKGLGVYFQALTDRHTIHAVRLTLLTAAIVIPLNLLFGLAAAWAVAKFDFRGKNFLVTLIDLPFSVSPVIAGMVFVLLFGAQGIVGPWFIERGMKIIFGFPGIALATLFVTFPLIARELIPLMQSQGREEEESALTLGAGGWQTFLRVTLPNIRWGLLYGVILCMARAMGEFGAVSVVSGHIRGVTNTIPLHVEILYNEYNLTAAFAVASILVAVGLATLIVKAIMEKMRREEIRAALHLGEEI
ncbi:MAG: sulfate ABC transporter permease subunit CysW [Candidatus Omnitrophota bacterium]